MSMRVFAPAKINLTLKVGRPREDGRHPLESVVAFADIGDWLAAEAADTISLEIGGPFASQLTDEADNLVLRAARALSAHAPGRGAALYLEKNLPVASGMGGGSSDAAAALKALSSLWRLPLEGEALNHIARGLGADVPACLAARSGWMSGTGESFAPLYVPGFDAVLVNPGVGLATRDVYAAFDRMELGAAFATSAAPALTSLATALDHFRIRGNDLEAPACALAPEIGEALAVLRPDARTVHAAMTGSGATVFALTETADSAESLAADLAAAHPRWWVRAALLGGA